MHRPLSPSFPPSLLPPSHSHTHTHLITVIYLCGRHFYESFHSRLGCLLAAIDYHIKNTLLVYLETQTSTLSSPRRKPLQLLVQYPAMQLTRATTLNGFQEGLKQHRHSASLFDCLTQSQGYEWWERAINMTSSPSRLRGNCQTAAMVVNKAVAPMVIWSWGRPGNEARSWPV